MVVVNKVYDELKRAQKMQTNEEITDLQRIKEYLNGECRADVQFSRSDDLFSFQCCSFLTYLDRQTL